MSTIGKAKSIDTLIIKNEKVHFFSLVVGLISASILIGALYSMVYFLSDGFKMQYILHLVVLAYVAYCFFHLAFEYMWQGLGDEVIKIKSNDMILGKRVFGYFKAANKIEITQLEGIEVRKFQPDTIHGFKNALRVFAPNSDYYLEFRLKNRKNCGLWKNISTERKGYEIISDIENNLPKLR
jgi:hypothetical protein